MMQDNKQQFGKWRKASRSDANGGCVEVRFEDEDTILLRDSKLGNGSPVLTFNRHEWECFMDGANKGEFTLPS